MYQRMYSEGSANSANLCARAAVLVIFALVAFSERLLLSANTGGRGVIPVLDLVVPMWVFAAVLVSGRTSCFAFLAHRRFVWGSALFLCLGLLLPLFGVLVNDFPLRSLFVLNKVVLVFCALMVGSWAGETYLLSRTVRRAFIATLMAQLAMVLFQFSNILRFDFIPFARAICDWDLEFKKTWNENNVIGERPTGLFLNPNTLGVFAVLSFWFSVTFLRGKCRVFCAGCSLIIGLLSSSRGSLFAISLSILVFSFSGKWCSLLPDLQKFCRKVLVALIVAAILFPLAAMSTNKLQSVVQDSKIAERYAQAFTVLTSGSDQGGNFDGRVDAWQRAIHYIEDSPLGVLGPPQLVTNEPPDNAYVYFTLQGGIPYLFAFFMLLAGGIALKWDTPSSAFVGAVSVAMVANSVSCIPTSYSCFVLYWLCLGAALALRPNATPIRELQAYSRLVPTKGPR